MGTLGETLKSAREQKGLTLKDIADKTRINYNFLKAMEEDNFSLIPGEVFIAGFLKSYARELGLDEVEVLGLYKALKPAVEARPAQDFSEQKKAAAKAAAPALLKPLEAVEARKIPTYAVIIAGLVLGAVLTAAIILMIPKDKPPPVKAQPKVTAGVPAAVPFRQRSSAAPLFETKTSLAAGTPVQAPRKTARLKPMSATTSTTVR